MKRTELYIVGLLMIAIAPFARGDWRIEGETGILYQSNLSNSDRSADRQGDWAWTGEARLANGFQLSRDLRLTLTGDFRSFVWGQFCGFDEVDAGLSATVRYRFGLGSEAPWISLAERIGDNQFREDFRSGWDESVRLRGGLALSPRLALEAGYTFENVATAGDFWDQQGHRADLRLSFALTPSWQIGAGYSYRNGDVFSYAVPPRPDIARIAPVRPAVPTFGRNPFYNAYRLSGRTHAISAFAACNLTRYLAFKLSYEYSQTSHDPLRYENHLVKASLAFAY